MRRWGGEALVNYKKASSVRNSHSFSEMKRKWVHSTSFKKLMKYSIKPLIAITLFALSPTTAKGEDLMCKVNDPNDTYVNLRYPANGKPMRSLPNGSWIWVNPNGTEYDHNNNPWTAVINQRSKSPTGTEFVIEKFVHGCRSGSPFSNWFTELNQQ